MRAYRRSLDKPEALINVLVTASLEVDPAATFFREAAAARIVATVEDAPDDRVRRLEEVAEVWKVGRSQVDLPALLGRLHERGVERLLVEGGGELNWGFVRDGLLDELYVTVAPVLLGGRDAPTLLEGNGLAMDARTRLRLVEVSRLGEEIFCRYSVVRGGE
jgi:2,5-diamino-6-(ribosylamino)-4(3H)-pyrimidinone 5'-phosphate reductase